jgi:hypothetical protein
MAPIKLDVVVYEDGDLWVAQAIQFDIAARADKLTKIPRAFERALMANLSINHELGRDALDRIAPAPPEFREMFERAHLDLHDRCGSIVPPRGFEIGDLRLAELA